jgi:phage I-like protein
MKDLLERIVCDILRPGEGGAPEWFQAIPAGRVEMIGYEPAIMDAAAASRLIAAFRDLGRDMVIDYEHQTLGEGKAPAAGWIHELEWREGDGLWARASWTDEARGYIERREYRYFSPVFFVRKEDRRIVELYNLALTNQPRMLDIRALAAKARPEKRRITMLEKLRKLLGLQDDATEDQVLEAVKGKIDAQLAASPLVAVAKALGLKEEATEEQVVAAVKAKRTRREGEAVASHEVLEALGLEDGASRSEIVATIHALKQTPNLIERVAKLENDRAQREKEELVTQAIREGKVTPAQREWAESYAMKDPEGFRIFVAKAPALIPVGDACVIKDKGRRSDGLDDSQIQINKMLGISDEAWKKYNPASA